MLGPFKGELVCRLTLGGDVLFCPTIRLGYFLEGARSL
jgi:hypothetical protein